MKELEKELISKMIETLTTFVSEQKKAAKRQLSIIMALILSITIIFCTLTVGVIYTLTTVEFECITETETIMQEATGENANINNIKGDGNTVEQNQK